MGPAGALAWPPELEPAGEASLGQVDFQAPQKMADWRKGVPGPGAGGGLAPSRGSLNMATQERPPQTQVPCCKVGRRTEPRMGAFSLGSTGALVQGPAWAPDPKPAEEASPGPVASQVQAPQGTADMRKGMPTPGPSRGSLYKVTQGRPLQTLSQAPCHMAGWGTKPRPQAPTQGPAGAVAHTWTLNGQGKPPRSSGLTGPSGYSRQEEGSTVGAGVQ
ncbi:hypothetical protein NDU88_009626 [Pleurodeles waltl]|uniref:Uncharacterized protein n=1 Tax=Pleurodeles waltl TaxID=8319 RepID=A0AAV7QS25_PLEWA|nr:hypothetical protein NDU88_009626 [Pleurodeles waltl]